MTEVWLRVALWLGLALSATLISIRLRVAAALSKIVVGTISDVDRPSSRSRSASEGNLVWLERIVARCVP